MLRYTMMLDHDYEGTFPETMYSCHMHNCQACHVTMLPYMVWFGFLHNHIHRVRIRVYAPGFFLNCHDSKKHLKGTSLTILMPLLWVWDGALTDCFFVILVAHSSYILEAVGKILTCRESMNILRYLFQLKSYFEKYNAHNIIISAESISYWS